MLEADRHDYAVPKTGPFPGMHMHSRFDLTNPPRPQGRCRVADDEPGAPAMIDDEARRGCCEKLGVCKLVGTAR
jgi:hypothetical protein